MQKRNKKKIAKERNLQTIQFNKINIENLKDYNQYIEAISRSS